MIPVPNLDDRRFSDLVEEVVSSIPHVAPEWTNHNPSDPGITVIEALAYFTEILIYRLNQTTPEIEQRFLELLGERTSDRSDGKDSGHEALHSVLARLQAPERGVTASDFVNLAQRAADRRGTGGLLAACAFPDHDLSCLTEEEAESSGRPGHVSVVLIPSPGQSVSEEEDLRSAIETDLRPRCLLTTRLHVLLRRLLTVEIGATIRSEVGADPVEVQKRAIDTLASFRSKASDGRELGRPIYLSELYAVLDRVEGVASVKSVRVHRVARGDHVETADTLGIQVAHYSTIGRDARFGVRDGLGGWRYQRDEWGRLVAIALHPHEVARISVSEENTECRPIG